MDADFINGGGSGLQSTKNAAVIDGDGELAEAFAKVAGKQTAKTASAAKPLTVQAAVKLARALQPKPGVKLADDQQKTLDIAKRAGARLERLLAKTAEQMAQDGATKLADYFDPEIVPAWAKQACADMRSLQTIYNQAAARKAAKVAKVASTEEVIKERQLSDTEIKNYIHNLLNQSIPPNIVEEKLKKLAEVSVFNKDISTQYLNDNAGLLGYAYIKPNEYMNDCAQTQKHLDVKIGGTKAKSVQQIGACTNCQNFRQTAGVKHCSLYSLPVVASQSDLLPIINNLTSGAKNKKAALVRLANKEVEHAQPSAKKSSFGRAEVKGQALTLSAKQARPSSERAGSFTATDVLTLHNSGAKLQTIFQQGSKIAGADAAKTAVRKFLAGIGRTKTRVSLEQIDCRVLAAKLSANNTILGSSKCADCSYRGGMHCGLTGGTLVSFPGMDKVKSNHRVASGAPKDGMGMVQEFELDRPVAQHDIETKEAISLDVDLTSFSKVDL
jgi:hypothetical protein